MDEGRIVSGNREAFNFMTATAECADGFIEMGREHIDPLMHKINRGDVNERRAFRQADQEYR